MFNLLKLKTKKNLRIKIKTYSLYKTYKKLLKLVIF